MSSVQHGLSAVWQSTNNEENYSLKMYTTLSNTTCYLVVYSKYIRLIMLATEASKQQRRVIADLLTMGMGIFLGVLSSLNHEYHEPKVANVSRAMLLQTDWGSFRRQPGVSRIEHQAPPQSSSHHHATRAIEVFSREISHCLLHLYLVCSYGLYRLLASRRSGVVFGMLVFPSDSHGS
jgi:hypothetical protein